MLRSVCLFLLSFPTALGSTTHWFRQPVDHYDLSKGEFEERYLVDSEHATVDGPLLFFCGNEGDVTTFARFSGFVAEVAKHLGGLAVYAEHRFYGQSLPFHRSSFQRDHIDFLTVEQALADYAALLRHLLKETHRKVITFGGSYGGMLSSWMRSKFPSLVFAAVASSAPVQFSRVGPSFFELVTDAAVAMDPRCPKLTREGFAALTTRNWRDLENAFGLCRGQDPDVEGLTLWARNAFVTVAMGNYPYAADLFGSGLKHWPLKVACAELSKAKAAGLTSLSALASAVGSYYNASGQIACHNITGEYRTCADQTGCGTASSPWGEAWDIEACTQIVYFTSTNNRTDMFPPRSWNLPQLRSYCENRWGVSPKPEWFEGMLDAIKNSSRIVFTNGLLDPWRGGGILNNLSDTLVAIHIPRAAHIYDLAGSHANDTTDVLEARQQVVSLLRTWLEEDNEHDLMV
eukprot:TRINITY_DN83875_c0_g1_i1.p1 TRINITY_DN83875_c0_g1~~TRINITY_DN83875_c0_g1_i1.p1  ORF type:complete len:460 (-),score=40.67 TRINITY_DN83875_c0_g1_i1:32-1411(-)